MNVPCHGERSRYGSGCRCVACRRTNTLYQRGYRAGMRGPELAAFAVNGTVRTAQAAPGRRVTWIERELPL